MGYIFYGMINITPNTLTINKKIVWTGELLLK